MGKTKISWADETLNPVTGCSHVSEGCRNCYAEAVSHKHKWTTKPWSAANAAENVVLHPERLAELRKRREADGILYRVDGGHLPPARAR